LCADEFAFTSRVRSPSSRVDRDCWNAERGSVKGGLKCPSVWALEHSSSSGRTSAFPRPSRERASRSLRSSRAEPPHPRPNEEPIRLAEVMGRAQPGVRLRGSEGVEWRTPVGELGRARQKMGRECFLPTCDGGGGVSSVAFERPTPSRWKCPPRPSAALSSTPAASLAAFVSPGRGLRRPRPALLMGDLPSIHHGEGHTQLARERCKGQQV